MEHHLENPPVESTVSTKERQANKYLATGSWKGEEDDRVHVPGDSWRGWHGTGRLDRDLWGPILLVTVVSSKAM